MGLIPGGLGSKLFFYHGGTQMNTDGFFKL